MAQSTEKNRARLSYACYQPRPMPGTARYQPDGGPAKSVPPHEPTPGWRGSARETPPIARHACYQPVSDARTATVTSQTAARPRACAAANESMPDGADQREKTAPDCA